MGKSKRINDLCIIMYLLMSNQSLIYELEVSYIRYIDIYLLI